MAAKLCDLLEEVTVSGEARSLLAEFYRNALGACDASSDLANEIKRRLDEVQRMASHFVSAMEAVGERRTCAAFDAICSLGIEHSGFVFHPCESPITSVRREVAFPCGRVDRLIHHEDGSITLVEIKQRGSRRDIAQAIGQVLMYGVAAKQLIDASDYHLAICVSGDKDEWIEAACESTGIAYMAISDQMHKVVDAFAIGYARKNKCESLVRN